MTKQLMRLTLVLLLGGAAAGCMAVGAVAYVVTPPPDDPAAYKLDKAPTLVLAENYENPAQFEVYAEQLQRAISEQLTENKAGTIIESQKLVEMRGANKQAFHKMDLPAVGRALGAKRVIYVDLVQFSVNLPIGGENLAGRAEAHVKVVEVATGKTVWPLDSSTGRAVKVETTYEPDPSGNTPAGIENQLNSKLGNKIARLFYNAPTDSVDGGDREFDQKM